MPIMLSPPNERDYAPLPERLASLGRMRKRVAGAAGIFSLIAASIAAIALACGLDAWLHVAALPRAFALVGTLATAGIIWFRRIEPAFRLSTHSLAIALELEERFPRLNDSLASAVSFLGEGTNDSRGVSRTLRSAAVRRAERLAERHDFEQLVPSGRGWRNFWLAAVVVGAAMPLALWNTDRTATALVRFADPFGNHPWPAKTRIEVLAPRPLPARIPKGDVFELRFAVRGELPERAAVSFHVIGGEEFEEVYPLTKVDQESMAQLPPGAGSKNGPVAVVSAKYDAGRLAQNFQFRIRANDADTGWQRVEVAPPPRLVPLEGRASPQINAIPPRYTGLAPIDLPDGAGVIEVPMGTTIALRAAADLRLASAVLQYHGDRSAVERVAGLAALGRTHAAAAIGARLLANAVGADEPLVLSADGKVMQLAFKPSLSGMYALKLTDETGLSGTRLLEIRLSPDPAPTVTLLRPSLGRDPPIVVPTAAITVHVAGEDKVYALRKGLLEYRVGREGTVRTIPVADAASILLGPAARLAPTRFEASFTLPVSQFLRDDGTPARDGDSVFLRAAAGDWDDVSVLKEPGRSGEFELRIASRDAIEAILQKELAALRPELMRAREQQREAAQLTADARPLPDGTLSPADREKLLAAEYAQRQVRGKVADPRDGLRAKAEMLREMARANNLTRSHATDRAQAAAEELARISDRELAPVEPLLGDARQFAALPVKAPMESPVPGMLNRITRHQKSIDDGLTGLIELLSQWGDAGALRGDARLLRETVLREAANAEKLSEKVPPGKPPESLKPDQRADLDRAAGRLDQLADQTNGLLSRAAKLAGEKKKEAEAAAAAAKGKEAEADGLMKKAATLPPGTPERNAAEAKAAALREQAAELKAAASQARTEASALRKAVEQAGGQALPEDIRKAAEALRSNRQSDSAAMDRFAADRLERFADSLVEHPAEAVPELAKKKKHAADQLDALAAQQDELRKKAEEANRAKDDVKRSDELKRLAPEQQKLVDQTRDLLQKLQRDRSDEAAKDARTALEKMESARDDLERGMNPANDQKDATEKLDAARDKLDEAAAKAPQELTDEKRRKLANLVKALYERQKAAAAEADRIQAKILAEKKWSRPILQSYKDLEDREAALSVEVRTLSEREFADLLVFQRVVKDAADAIDKAAEKANLRRQDALDALDADSPFDAELEKSNAVRIRRPMDRAVRRLEQVLEALKPENALAKKDEKKSGGAPPAGGPMGPMPMGGTPANGDVIPPLAQLKALRALQAELNEQTAEFDKLHPDRDKLMDEDREELKEIEDGQREIAALFEEIAKLFQMKDLPPEEGKP